MAVHDAASATTGNGSATSSGSSTTATTSTSNGTSSDGKKVIPVRVAVRVRPVVKREMKEFYSSSLEVASNQPQVSSLCVSFINFFIRRYHCDANNYFFIINTFLQPPVLLCNYFYHFV